MKSVYMLSTQDPIKKYRINNKSLIYNNRKDVCAIKNKILKEVKNPEYWATLVAFLHKEVSKEDFDKKMERLLFTNELRLLHNEMIRAILFNAHFSSIPPPGVVISQRKPEIVERAMPPMPKPGNSDFKTFTVNELTHLPSVIQLHERIRFILYMNSAKLKLDKDVANTLQENLFLFIFQILQECLSLANPNFSLSESARIQPRHLIEIYYSGSSLSKILSNEIITKYTSLLP
ncbi:hypothetical protein M9Y10_021637 [Tritrichomonas musculus]|uniref:Uncharacterized protein n=1 Tax=Tritrichomonas musculus TaxID=1915356 RepID=A0ABR2KQX6_9EUKA